MFALHRHKVPLTNLIFEGNGLLGFVGSYEALQTFGHTETLQTIGGTASGAIVAMLLALGYTPEETIKKLRQLQFFEVKHHDGVRHWDIRWIPEVHTGEPVPTLTTSGNLFYQWLQHCVNERLNTPNATFVTLNYARNAQPHVFKNLTVTAMSIRNNSLQEFSFLTERSMKIADAVRAAVAFSGPFHNKEHETNQGFSDNDQHSVFPISLLNTPARAAPFHNLEPGCANQGTLHIHHDSQAELQTFSWYEGIDIKQCRSHRYGNLLPIDKITPEYAKSINRVHSPFPSLTTDIERHRSNHATTRWNTLYNAPKKALMHTFEDITSLKNSAIATPLEKYEMLEAERVRLEQERQKQLHDCLLRNQRNKVSFQYNQTNDEKRIDAAFQAKMEPIANELRHYHSELEITVNEFHLRQKREKELFDKLLAKREAIPLIEHPEHVSLKAQIWKINEELSPVTPIHGKPQINADLKLDIAKLHSILDRLQNIISYVKLTPNSENNVSLQDTINLAEGQVKRIHEYLQTYMQYMMSEEYVARQFVENLETLICKTKWKTNLQFENHKLYDHIDGHYIVSLPTGVRHQLDEIQKTKKMGDWLECSKKLLAMGQFEATKNDHWFTGRKKETKQYYSFFVKKDPVKEVEIFDVAKKFVAAAPAA